jgi:hypothetical protein
LWPTLRDSFTKSNGRGFQHTQVLVAFLGLNARVASLVRYEKTQPESGTAGCLSESRAPRYPTG